MPENTSVHSVLYEEEWDLSEIQLILQRDPSSANEVEGSQSPLLRVLTDRRCSIAIVKLLLYYGADPNFQFCHGGPTPLINALHCRNRLETIRTLVEGGARADLPDDSSLSIALALNAELEVIRLLLIAGGDLHSANISGQSPLFHALGHFNVSIFTFLLDYLDMNVNTAKNQCGGSLLHSALCINGCTAVFVKFLISSGIDVDSVDEFGDTPLHKAVQNQTGHPSVVEILLRRGSHVNVKNRNGLSPLDLAIENGCSLAIVQLLLKYCLLEKPDFNIEDWTREHELQGMLSEYAIKCEQELHRMKSDNLGNGRTLFEFMQMYSGYKMYSNAEEGFNVDQLLLIIANKRYPLYSQLISSKLERSLLKDKLEECNVYTAVKGISDVNCSMPRKVLLNYDCACVLANYLDQNDLLSVIIAFCN